MDLNQDKDLNALTPAQPEPSALQRPETSEAARCEISGDRQRLQLDRIKALLAGTYWAHARSPETIERSIEHSICYGAYLDGVQVGFARIVTDHATTFYLCDVVVDSACRGLGIGKKMVRHVLEDPQYEGMLGILATRDAHGLYEHFGFKPGGERFMSR